MNILLYIRTELFILMILIQCEKWPRLASPLSISNHNYRYMYWQWNLYTRYNKKKNNIKIFKTYPYLQISMTEPRHHSYKKNSVWIEELFLCCLPFRLQPRHCCVLTQEYHYYVLSATCRLIQLIASSPLTPHYH